MTLRTITGTQDKLAKLVAQDPVRPEIPLEFRVSDNRNVFILVDDTSEEKPQAVICVAYTDMVPMNVSQLLIGATNPDVAVFYSVWSYAKGSGRNIIFAARDEIKSRYPNIKRFVTLSPLTEPVRNFHLRNGATVFRTNTDTVNYEYK